MPGSAGLVRVRKEGAQFSSRIANAIHILSTSRIAIRNNIKQTVFRSRMRYVQQTFVEYRYRSEGFRMKHQVVIAGGGPTGMMLAGELTLAGVDVVMVERRASGRSACPNHRGLRSARHCGSISGRRAEGAGRRVCRGPFRSQRLSHPPPLQSRAAAKPHRANPGRLDRRAEGADLSRH